MAAFGCLALGVHLLLAAQAPAVPAAGVSQPDAIDREARLAASAAGQPDRAAARQKLRAVLSQRAFAQAQTTSWMDEALRKAGEWLSDLWSRTFGLRVGQRSFAFVLAWVTSVAAVLALLAWLTRMAARRRAEAPVAIGTIPPHRTAGRELALEAATLIQAGRLRDAARVAYRAAVHRLEEEGAFTVDEARTPREYSRTPARAPSPPRQPVGAHLGVRAALVRVAPRRDGRRARDARAPPGSGMPAARSGELTLATAGMTAAVLAAVAGTLLAPPSADNLPPGSASPVDRQDRRPRT